MNQGCSSSTRLCMQQVDDDADRGRTRCPEMSNHGRRLLGVERLVADAAPALDEMTDDPGAPAGGARGAEAQPPSLPPELVPQGARALLVALAEPSANARTAASRSLAEQRGRARYDAGRR